MLTIPLPSESQVTLGSNYLEINSPSITDAELNDIFRTLNSTEKSSMFWIGDFLNAVSHRKGEAYSKLLAHTGYKNDTLWKAASVCRRIPKEHRSSVSYSHHKEAIDLCKSNLELAAGFLKVAEREQFNIKDLRTHIRLSLADAGQDSEQLDGGVSQEAWLRFNAAINQIRGLLNNANPEFFSKHGDNIKTSIGALWELVNEIESSEL